MHPLSQKVPIDNIALFLKPGKMCASLTFLASAVFGSSALRVEFIISPFEIFTGSGILTCWFSTQGKSSVRQCPVVPESATTSVRKCIILLVIEVDKN